MTPPNSIPHATRAWEVPYVDGDGYAVLKDRETAFQHAARNHGSVVYALVRAPATADETALWEWWDSHPRKPAVEAFPYDSMTGYCARLLEIGINRAVLGVR
jgi:hypothetical protein